MRLACYVMTMRAFWFYNNEKTQALYVVGREKGEGLRGCEMAVYMMRRGKEERRGDDTRTHE